MSSMRLRTALAVSSGLPVGAWLISIITVLPSSIQPDWATFCWSSSTVATSRIRTMLHRRSRLHHHVLELTDILQAGIGDDVGDGEIAFRLAGRGLHVVGEQGGRDIGPGDAARRHALRVQPQAHGEAGAAGDDGGADTGHGRQHRLHRAGQIVGDLRRLHLIAGEAEDHDRSAGIAQCALLVDDRIVGLTGNLVLHLLDLRQNLGQRLVGVIIELEIDGDAALPLAGAGGDVVDALGRGDRLLQRRGDEALHQLWRRARITGRDRDRGGLQIRKLPDRQLQHGTQPDEEDQRADHGGQYRPADEEIGEIMHSSTLVAGRAGLRGQHVPRHDHHRRTVIEAQLARTGDPFVTL